MSTVEPLRSGFRRRPTSTSSFGVGRREAHDSSPFYARFTPPLVSDDCDVAPHAVRDAIWAGDARDMDRFGQVADRSVALVVTSPPYFAGKEYEAVLGAGHVPADYEDYLGMLHDVFSQCFDKLEPGGRIAVNVANLGRKPYRSLSRDVIDLLEGLGYLLRGEVIWQKSHAAGGSCAWGTYQRPGNPVLRDVSERIVVASKGRFDRALSAAQRASAGLPSEGTMTMDEFIDATIDVWDIPSESATRVGHPAPFPVELPRRLIELFTYRDDLVLDPFMGSGSTALAAIRTERHYVGFDTDEAYVALAERRIAEARDAPGRPGTDHRVTVAPGRSASAGGHDAFDLDVARGQKAAELARRALEVSGFEHIERNVSFGELGIGVDFRARDARGGLWLFDLSGGFSVTRPGLRRPDVLWKALGKASVLHEARQQGRRKDLAPLIVLSTDVPAAGSAGAKSLRAVQGGPVHDVLELLDPDCMARLGSYGKGDHQAQ
ncbi:MAG TPA: site-specific DNA-methyltransferase [Acidimicrobiales bacterium]|jgi:site-specific DNA-methyltransferase (adenine-specific)|nr:site-specific DNA-methyltransferase [Acidimicrobiales bacterium]